MYCRFVFVHAKSSQGTDDTVYHSFSLILDSAMTWSIAINRAVLTKADNVKRSVWDLSCPRKNIDIMFEKM